MHTDARSEIEDVLAGDPSVLESAVIGVPEEKWGEVVAAYVQPRPGLTVDPAVLEALCARSLSGYKRPTSYVVVEALAKNAVGKIDKSRCGRLMPPRRPPLSGRRWGRGSPIKPTQAA